MMRCFEEDLLVGPCVIDDLATDNACHTLVLAIEFMRVGQVYPFVGCIFRVDIHIQESALSCVPDFGSVFNGLRVELTIFNDAQSAGSFGDQCGGGVKELDGPGDFNVGDPLLNLEGVVGLFKGGNGLAG